MHYIALVVGAVTGGRSAAAPRAPIPPMALVQLTLHINYPAES